MTWANQGNPISTKLVDVDGTITGLLINSNDHTERKYFGALHLLNFIPMLLFYQYFATLWLFLQVQRTTIFVEISNTI